MPPTQATPSRTSQAVAAWRATLSRPSSPAGDPDAQAILAAGMSPVVDPTTRARLSARTVFFDTRVALAVAGAPTQVVVLGAGYDDRALRFRTPGVRFFEVDHPATQDDKRRRLEEAGLDCSGLTLVAADFRVDDVAVVLERAGHRADLPTLVLAEGLLVYLDESAVVGLLGRGAGPRRRREQPGRQPGRPSRGVRLGVGHGPGQRRPARGCGRTVAHHPSPCGPPGPGGAVGMDGPRVGRRSLARHRGTG